VAKVAASLLALCVLAISGVIAAALADPVPTREETCAEPPASPATVAALKPADATLAITSPRAGETVSAPGGLLSVDVEYWGPRLVEANEARSVDEYHLVFLLDVASTAYVGTLRPVPRCTNRVISGAVTHVIFRNVASGVHSLTVLLVGSNDVAVNPPMVAGETFMVK
jgi:hypothetical protein